MTGRRQLDEAELIERLGRLPGQLAWPPTPDLAGRVSATLEARAGQGGTAPVGGYGAGGGTGIGLLGRLRELVGGGPVGGRRVVRRSLLIAIVALLAIVVAAAAIGLGVPGIRIELRPNPSPTQTPTPAASAPGPSSLAVVTPAPTPPGPELGPTVTLDQARSGAGFGLLVPTDPAYTTPSEVHLVGVAPFVRVTLLYPNGAALTEFLGEVQPDAFQKMVGPGTTVEPVRVGTSDGYWITGAPHEVMIMYRDPDGQTRWQEVAVTGNVLIWQVGAVTLRFETPLGRDAAVAVAASLR